MNDNEIKKQLEDILNSDEVWKIFEDNMRKWARDYYRYGEFYQRIYPPGGNLPPYIGWSGHEV